MPRTLFFALGTPAQCREFFARFDPDASAIADPDARFYADFALERGSVSKFLGPAVLGNGLRVLIKGHAPGIPIGDVRQMPGVFLVRGETVHAKHIAQHAADQPDVRDIAAQSKRLSTIGEAPA